MTRLSILILKCSLSELGPAPALIKTGFYSEVKLDLTNVTHIDSFLLARCRCIIDESARAKLKLSVLPPSSSKVYSYIGRMDLFKGFQYIYPYKSHEPDTFFSLKKVENDRTEYLYEDCRRVFGLANIPNNYIDSLTDAWTELANNIFYHSGDRDSSGWGYIHAQAYLNSKKIKVALSDTGVGFYGSYSRTGQVRNRSESQIITDSFNLHESCLNPIPGRGHRGVGLSLVKDFVSINGGVVYIWSGRTIVTVNQSGIRSQTLGFNTVGTVIEMIVKIV